MGDQNNDNYILNDENKIKEDENPIKKEEDHEIKEEKKEEKEEKIEKEKKEENIGYIPFSDNNKPNRSISKNIKKDDQDLNKPINQNIYDNLGYWVKRKI